MREIKFRAWDILKKEMCWVDEWNPVNMIVRALRPNAKPHRISGDSNHSVLMQYTGLKDKNGKEIYEEDVVKYQVANSDIHSLGKVYFNESNATFKVDYYTFDKVYKTNLEIIGNVFENPELLESEGK